MGSYTVCAVIAIIVTSMGFFYSGHKKGGGTIKLCILSFCLIAVTLIGSRLLYFLTNRNQSLNHVFDFEAHGFSLYGGLVAAALTGICINRLQKGSAWRFADDSAVWVGIGIAIMKIGCLLHGCCFGKETSVPWAITPPLLSPAHRYQLLSPGSSILFVHPIHPTQIYELIVALSGSLLAFSISKKKNSPGLAALVFILWLTSWRWIIYYLRAVPVVEPAALPLYPIMYGVLLIYTAGTLSYRYKRSLFSSTTKSWRGEKA